MSNQPIVIRPGSFRSPNASQLFDLHLQSIEGRHRPSSFPFFMRLAALPSALALDPDLLGKIHLTYQAAMHATRAMIYFLPHLDSPELRRRKLQIYVDDDGLADGTTHHYQFTNAFRALGARLRLDDDEFGDLDELCRALDNRTAEFVRTVKTLYPWSLGPWCVIERLSHNWMRSLMDALAVHAPRIRTEPYFAECFADCVEQRHAEESFETTSLVLAGRPELLDRTVADAWAMARSLDLVWHALDDIVARAAKAAA
jgi:hypothetical protein